MPSWEGGGLTGVLLVCLTKVNHKTWYKGYFIQVDHCHILLSFHIFYHSYNWSYCFTITQGQQQQWHYNFDWAKINYTLIRGVKHNSHWLRYKTITWWVLLLCCQLTLVERDESFIWLKLRVRGQAVPRCSPCIITLCGLCNSPIGTKGFSLVFRVNFSLKVSSWNLG